MKIAVIEDERLTADDLCDMILVSDPQAVIVAKLASVREAILYFSRNEKPDVIFSDIQLGDGLSFEIFQELELNVPIIFCTAYDEYAIEAFKMSGIHYILKPFDERDVALALVKYKSLQASFVPKTDTISQAFDLLKKRMPVAQTSILVHYRDMILPVKFENIAVFYIRNEVTMLCTFDNQKYPIGKTLDEIQQLTGHDFFRVNRQFIVNRSAVKSAAQYFSRKLALSLTVPVEDSILISREKIKPFLEWLEGYQDV